jgi:uncharacterized membrane protein HdeD (DUF308 family)
MFGMTERKLKTSYFVLLYCGLMLIVFGVWLVLFQYGDPGLEGFKAAGTLGGALLIVGILTCIASTLLIERNWSSTEGQATKMAAKNQRPLLRLIAF